jgi:hypothetical protein
LFRKGSKQGSISENRKQTQYSIIKTETEPAVPISSRSNRAVSDQVKMQWFNRKAVVETSNSTVSKRKQTQ